MTTNKQSHERRKKKTISSHINRKKEKRKGVQTVNILSRGIDDISALKVQLVRSY